MMICRDSRSAACATQRTWCGGWRGFLCHTVIAVLVFGGFSHAIAEEATPSVPLEAIALHEDFEEAAPKMQNWAKNGAATVNFIGLSEERAFKGKRSLKFDVTIEGGSYSYWGVSLPLPAEGTLNMSAQIYVEEGTTARVGFGTNMMYPPAHHSGCGSHEVFDKPTGEWRKVEMDVVDRGRTGADSVLPRQTFNLVGTDASPRLDRWSLFILGGKGKRVIVYIDDLRVEGEIPSEAAHKKERARRWAGAQERLEKEWLGPWRTALQAGTAALENLSGLPDSVTQDVAALQKTAVQAEARVAALAKKGYGAKGDAAEIERMVLVLKHGPRTVQAIADGLRSGAPWLIYTPHAITDAQLTGESLDIPAPPGKKLVCAGCPGEYESMTAAVYALEDIEEMRVEVSDLGDAIPASAVDVHVVKSWFQAGREIWFKQGIRLLSPELLLKDDRLVRVDMKEKHNYVRSTAKDGSERYVRCSEPTSEALADIRPVDADTLQPVDIPKRTLKQFWFTVRIPDDAKPGTHTGTVTFSTKTGSFSLPITVTVHPFALAPSRLTYSIYYRAKLSEDGNPTIGSERKSEEQFRAELADMLAHGVPYPSNYQGWDDRLLKRVMALREEVGLPHEHFYNLGGRTGSSSDPAVLKRHQTTVRKWVDFCRGYGYENVYFYGIDEARGDRLKSQRAAWGAVQEAGGKTFVACYKRKTFEAMGALLDCAVMASKPDLEEAALWHGVDSEIFCYAYPQVGNEEPERYRRNFGLVLWKAGYDGAMNYAYQHGFGHVWNDFDHGHYRDHNFTYPTVNGVVGTIQWEGFREGVDDVRYVTTLEQAIEAASAAKADIAKQARAWLEALDPEKADLYDTRAEMVKWITACR